MVEIILGDGEGARMGGLELLDELDNEREYQAILVRDNRVQSIAILGRMLKDYIARQAEIESSIAVNVIEQGGRYDSDFIMKHGIVKAISGGK